MSLSDSIFIFVLALIIFGPKKLPEMAKQLGKLVGEFRRASNEFKFQIEDELRQADLQDRKESATIEPTILPPTESGAPSEPIAAEPASTEIVTPPEAPVIVAAAGAEPRQASVVDVSAKETLPPVSTAIPAPTTTEVETTHD